MRDERSVRALAAERGYRLVKGKGRIVGRKDWGKFGLEKADTGHKAFGFGNRGVTARLEDVARFLEGGDPFAETLKASAKRR